jgi:poly(A) polymerase
MVLSHLASVARRFTVGKATSPHPIVRKRDNHIISRKNINADALKVLYRLNRSGFSAYLVGGGVRDLLLNMHPKDFDISTDAHPNQIKKLFRNCYLVGRRFRLAHIRFGDHVVETSTFRSQPSEEAGKDGELYQHRDNTFGTPAEDAARRDFTVNGLFYDISNFTVVDYVGGLKDLEDGIIRSIGNPNIRFREDPVRMVRALRFASRLGFRIEPVTWKAILKHHGEIEKASSARMLEEIFKLYAHGVAEPNFRLLWQTGLLADLIPQLASHIDASGGKNAPLWSYLSVLDKGDYLKGYPTRALQVAVLFAPLYRDTLRAARDEGVHKSGAEIAHDLLMPFAQRYSLPKRQFYRVAHILDLQRRFHPKARRFKKPLFVQQDYFPETLAMRAIVLRAEGKPTESVDKWLRVYEDVTQRTFALTEDAKPSLGTDEQPRRGQRRGRRPRRRRRGGENRS